MSPDRNATGTLTMKPMIYKLTKPQLIEVLEHVQHFKPPRVTRQDVGHLRNCVRRALNSERYGATAGAAIRSVLGEANEVLGAAAPASTVSGEPAALTYTNYRGETAVRTITPKSVFFGSTDWHPEPQWLLAAFDHDKQADRTFALKDFGHAPTVSGEALLEKAFDFEAHLQRQRDWSEKTFGPGSRTYGLIDHIRKELSEIEADPTDITEWIDVVILALDGAWRAGYQPREIINAIVGKQAKNEARSWPDWRTMPEDQAIEHVRALAGEKP